MLNNLTELHYILCAVNPLFYFCIWDKIVKLAFQKGFVFAFIFSCPFDIFSCFFLFDFLLLDLLLIRGVAAAENNDNLMEQSGSTVLGGRGVM